jgi:hypothetical protein
MHISQLEKYPYHPPSVKKIPTIGPIMSIPQSQHYHKSLLPISVSADDTAPQITLAAAPPSNSAKNNRMLLTGDWAQETAKKVSSLKTKVVLQSSLIKKPAAADVLVCWCLIIYINEQIIIVLHI